MSPASRGSLVFLCYGSGPYPVVIGRPPGGVREKEGKGGLLPYISYMGMCQCEGYGFKAV